MPRHATIGRETESLTGELNRALASEYQAVIMYTTFAASVQGPYRPQLKQFFDKELPDELGHARFLAEKVAALGEYPTVEPLPVPCATDPKEMLESVRAAELDAVKLYKRISELAHEHGDIGLATRLEAIAEDETEHFEEAEKILCGW